ncbi:hypothetical protein EV652_105542 [Kribbella steppae]|uniref:Lipoprotein n=1 Tax=Kribbella steppae TaxID=2512223 RepID=A0A4R2HKK1_9ACTN|nr:hypothetical protein [Kribbella steppae]TCO30540.1 hypothetical protein EV652_105542 [Kribbella steppae]
MRVTSVLVTAGLVVATVTACSGGDDKAETTPAPPSCVGKDTPDSTHVLSSGPVNLPSGGRAVLQETHLDANPPTARLSLLGTDAGETTAADVSVGGTVTVKATKYSVVEICSDRVQLAKS